MNVIALQLDIAWENKPANFDKARRLLTAAKPPKDSLVVLPEMFATGFSMNAEVVAEAYGGPTEQFLAGTGQRIRRLPAGRRGGARARWPASEQGAGILARRGIARLVCQNAAFHAGR